MTTPTHGGTDAGPPAGFDFSTNANALGTSPIARAALRAVDPAGYPDPAYTELRVALAAWHGRHADEVVVGAGACELIHRAVRAAGGPVVLWEPTFGEYRYAADVAGVPVRAAHDLDTWLRLLPGSALAFLCIPNSPDGSVVDPAPLANAAADAGCRLVVDLAYHPLSQVRPDPPDNAWQLWAPNKAHGVTGVRAAYLVTDTEAAARLRRAPSWVLSTHGVAFLATLPSMAAQRWVADTRAILWQWRDELADRLRTAGVAVTVGPANFLLAHVGDAAGTAARLRRAGIRVRDATSFGLPDAIRLSAQPAAAQEALLAALRASIPTTRSPAPIANRISVADGSSETMRMTTTVIAAEPTASTSRRTAT
jgi:histidinol-phosphate aminotransferase